MKLDIRKSIGLRAELHRVVSGVGERSAGNAIVSHSGMKLHSSVNGPRDTGSLAFPLGPNLTGLFCAREFGNMLFPSPGCRLWWDVATCFPSIGPGRPYLRSTCVGL